jgi:hypothetical protein
MEWCDSALLGFLGFLEVPVVTDGREKGGEKIFSGHPGILGLKNMVITLLNLRLSQS